MAPDEGSVLVPAADGRGTNAAFRRPANLFPLRFGNDSFKPHLAAAQATGKVVPGLATAGHRSGRGQSRRFAIASFACRRNSHAELGSPLGARRPLSGHEGGDPMSEPRHRQRTTLVRPRAKKKSNPLPTEIRLIPISLADDIKPGDSLSEKLIASLQQHKIAFAAWRHSRRQTQNRFQVGRTHHRSCHDRSFC